MSLTVAALYAKFGPRLGPYVGLADLNDALTYALQGLGGTPSNPVADADVAGVAVASLAQLDDMVMCRCYETILNNLTDDMLREAGINEAAKDLRPGFERRWAKLEARLRDAYGIGMGSVVAGSVDLGFAQTDPCAIEPLWEC